MTVGTIIAVLMGQIVAGDLICAYSDMGRYSIDAEHNRCITFRAKYCMCRVVFESIFCFGTSESSIRRS
jgi:hypothetical protein